MIFADYIAMHFLDRVFDAPEMFSGFANVMAMIGYSLQIYGDFSGYTDIAIGLALLMGFKLPVNFNAPYKATNSGDYWKRWHISLSTWLRDYLYIPLGGNRSGSIASYIILALMLAAFVLAYRNWSVFAIVVVIVLIAMVLMHFCAKFKNHIDTNINLMLTMLIGGLWHGASLKFIIWGGLNGLGIVVYKYWRKISPYEHKTGWLAHAWKIFITFMFVTFTRIYFRGESMLHIENWYLQVANNMDWLHAWDVLVHYQLVFWVMLIGYVTHWLPEAIKVAVEQLYAKSPILIKIGITMVVGVLCYQAFSADFQPFIYFQF
jgi:D-alanyl-lipoteichoic acid acyltransferase DltB (MBOAT superfamily)